MICAKFPLSNNQYVPFIINCEEINRNAERPVKHEGKDFYTYLRETSGIVELPSNCLSKAKFCFLIDDYQKLNPDYKDQMDDAVHVLRKEGNLVILFSRIEGIGVHPPHTPGYTVMQIDTDAIAKDTDAFMEGRIEPDKRGAFKKYIEQYDSSVLGYYLTKSFLTMIFTSDERGNKGILRYIVNPTVSETIRDGKPLNKSQLYEAQTDYVIGNDVHRQDPSLSDERIIEKIKQWKNLLAEKAFRDVFNKK